MKGSEQQFTIIRRTVLSIWERYATKDAKTMTPRQMRQFLADELSVPITKEQYE